MSAKPFQCLSCRLKQSASRVPRTAQRYFHPSPTSNARKTAQAEETPAYPEHRIASRKILEARAAQVDKLAEHLKPYTAREKELLAQRYTPEQMAVIEAGEEAINPKDLIEQAKLRSDAFRPTYIDDFATERLLFEKEPTFHEDPAPEAEESQRWVRKGEEEPEDQKPRKLGIPGGLASQISDERDPSLLRLLQQTGFREEDLPKIRVKNLVMHRVVNQTRMGKISSMYHLTIAGNEEGMLGIGEGKSAESADASRQAMMNAIRNMRPIPRYEARTIFGEVQAKVGATVVQLSSRPPGFGNRTQHLIFELTRIAGISDLAARTPRSRNKMNVVKAAFKALTSQKLPDDVARARGRKMVDVRKVYYGGQVH